MFQQYDTEGTLHRTLISDKTMDKVLQIRAEQAGRQVPIHKEYGRVIWSGLSWASGEIRQANLQPGVPLTVTFESAEERPVNLRGHLYLVHLLKQPSQ